jgi:hypothetical protein
MISIACLLLRLSWQAESIADCCEANPGSDYRGDRNVVEWQEPDPVASEVDEATDQGGSGVNFFPENQRNFCRNMSRSTPPKVPVTTPIPMLAHQLNP